MIKFNQVYKRYPGGHEALKNLSFDVAEGEMVYLTGHSGAGKSTLLKLVAAIERPSSGGVLVKGQNIRSIKSAAITQLRRNIGLIFQDHKLLFDRNAFDNVMLPLQILRLRTSRVASACAPALDKVGLPRPRKSQPRRTFRRRTTASVHCPRHRESPHYPAGGRTTGNLDAEYSNEIMNIFKSFHQVGVTLLISTHDEGILRQFPARALHLKKGELQA